VQFVIEKDGSLKHAKVRGRELSENMNAQLVKIFEETPKWTPAQQNGRVLRTHFVCPVIFMPKADMMAKVDLPQMDQ
jgi:protein TonB